MCGAAQSQIREVLFLCVGQHNLTQRMGYHRHFATLRLKVGVPATEHGVYLVQLGLQAPRNLKTEAVST